jgi:membrane protease subunit (stomatin/prohibitin family)
MRIDVIHIQTLSRRHTKVKTLISTLTISAALLAPAATFAATTVAQTAPANAPAVASQPASKNDAPRVAMVKKHSDTGYGKQANDDREGLARIQEQTRQLGATN